ncbi:hypothetical protein IQ250_05610 [Pseudanabaenaceae cyanobacterium LEGE 13415]|nr:hypothetical protein [Pseudanabaenaceae cyanobacterium LEGE 13415]
MDEIDKLLSSLNNDASEPRPKPEAKSVARSSIEDLLKQVDTSPQIAPSPSNIDAPPQVASSSSHDRLFDELKQEREEALKQADREKQERLEQLKKQRRQALTMKAEEWLRNLDPHSNEGLWFEEFACNYRSRIEAAIDYLEALQEVDRD